MDEMLGVETLRCDSEFGSWLTSGWIPTPDDILFGLVERIWDFEGTLVFRREQLFPNGIFELVVQLDEPHRSVDRPASVPFPAICLNGLQTATSTIEAPKGRFRVLGIRLHPLGVFALLDASLDDFRDQSIDLRAAIGQPAAELGQRLDERRDSAGRVQTAAAWLRARIARGRAPDPIVCDLYARIRNDGGRVMLGQIDQLEGRSRSRLSRRFRQQIGLSPKRYARIVRFGRTLELLSAARDGESLSALALAAGFYDQAHMNADFREYARITPRRYLEATRFPNGTHLAHAIDHEDPGRFFQEDPIAIA